MKLLDVLRIYGFDEVKPSRLVRHAEADFDLELVVRLGFMDAYQARQGRARFKCEQIVAFIGERGTRSRFLGVYTVNGVSSPPPPWPPGYPYPETPCGAFYYDLDRQTQYDDLANRLIIDWGAPSSTRAWVQHVKDAEPKVVIELLPIGHVADFPGYEDLQLRFAELERIVVHSDSNRTWQRTLSAVAGVYLIADDVDGSLYVGSASGAQGIFGRWAGYVKSKHGGNKRLRTLLDQYPDRYKSFTFSILRTLSKGLTQKEVVQVEELYKRRLGSRAFGLNE